VGQVSSSPQKITLWTRRDPVVHPVVHPALGVGLISARGSCESRAMKRVVLVVTQGRDVGRSVVVNLGHCVMFGRSPDMTGATGMITQHSLFRLDDEDLRAVSRHLKIRAPLHQGARALFTSFERDPDVGLQDDAVSGRHAMIFVDEGGISQLDMGSTNGSFVNGARITEAELQLGDLVRIGETRLDVRG
jgi:hypothetical protein